MLLHPLPVRLDPAIGRGSGPATGWTLPVRPESTILLTFHGTAAVYQAVRALGLVEGAKVLVPSYNCGHELEPVLRAGASAGFYRIDESLDVDVADLESAIDASTRAVLVTHYFGFPQNMRPIRELCDRHGLALIEDCAHALFSFDGAQPLGITGDFAVYSLRKTLPLPHGGAVVCHDRRWSLPVTLPPPPILSTLVKWLERYGKSLAPRATGTARLLSLAALLSTRLVVDIGHGVAGLSRRLGALQWDPDDESIGFPAAVLGWGVADSVKAMLERVDSEAVVAARRRNFAQLSSAGARFVDCRPLIERLPPGVCPLWFPLVTEKPTTLLRRLRREAISGLQWWNNFHPAVPWERFPEASRLKENVVVLPVHQDLNEPHIERMIELLTASSSV